MKRLATALVIGVFVVASLTMTGCHRLGLVKAAPKAAASSPATKTGQ